MLLLVCIGSIGAVLYTPAIPAIGAYFEISDKLTEISMTVYLFAYAFGQLLCGPFSNRFGRKNALYTGLSIGVVGALLGVFSGSLHLYSVFILGRMFFAVGAGAGLQVVYTMIGDLYQPPKSIKIASYMALMFAISPSISTTIGGYLTQYIGWESCFYFLAIYCLGILCLCPLLPETIITKDKDALKPENFLKAYANQLQDKRVMLASAMIGLAIAFNYVFATLAPSLVITRMGVSPSNYGLYNIIPSIAVVLGAVLSGILASAHRKPLTQVFYAIALTFIGALLMLGCFSIGYINTYTLFIPYAVTLLGQPIIETNVLCLALHHHGNKAITSATINCITILFCMLFSLLGSLFGTDRPLFIPVIFLVLTASIFYLCRKLKKTHG